MVGLTPHPNLQACLFYIVFVLYWVTLLSEQPCKYVVVSVKLWTCNKLFFVIFSTIKPDGRTKSFLCSCDVWVFVCESACLSSRGRASVWLDVPTDVWMGIINRQCCLWVCVNCWKCHALVYRLSPPWRATLGELTEQRCHAGTRPLREETMSTRPFALSVSSVSLFLIVAPSTFSPPVALTWII